jgi:hypothetical protein
MMFDRDLEWSTDRLGIVGREMTSGRESVEALWEKSSGFPAQR